MVNEQTEVALLLSAPVFIAMIGLAPWVVHLLYSSSFSPAIEVLRWQILGDVLKVASWPMGFVILAAGAGKAFFYTETTALLLMGGLIVGLLPSMGLQITGIAFLVSYVYYLPLVYFLARRRIRFMWTGTVFWLLVVTLSLCVAVVLLSIHTKWGIPAAIVLSASFGCYTLARLVIMSNLGAAVGRLASMSGRLKIGMKNE